MWAHMCWVDTGLSCCSQHNQSISVRQYRASSAPSTQMPCWSLSHCLHKLIPSQETKTTVLVILRVRGRSCRWTERLILVLFILLHPVGITLHITNSLWLQSLLVHNELLPPTLNQRFCEVTIKGACWLDMQFVESGVWKLWSRCQPQSGLG